MSFSEIGALRLDGRVKGIPADVAAFPLGRIGEKKWNLLKEDFGPDGGQFFRDIFRRRRMCNVEEDT